MAHRTNGTIFSYTWLLAPNLVPPLLSRLRELCPAWLVSNGRLNWIANNLLTPTAALPDGTYLIVNGAQQGVAGFGLADFPNLQALLYDPTQPPHQRISILNTTIVARLYHSEATVSHFGRPFASLGVLRFPQLLQDGRVLISGSDPQTNNPDGTIKFPEEFRVEVYIPPYLNEGRIQPSYNLTQNDWVYGGSYPITVHLPQGTTDTMRVSLIAGKNHGFIFSTTAPLTVIDSYFEYTW